ncbi:MAG TPA: helix-turn-helix transcriptional regulator [Actinomycetota bacterium]|nr:helix-turn-helix transcriptional regulator [Actinomycetota bacterium]
MGRTVRRLAGNAEPVTTGQRLSWLMAERGITSKALAATVGIQESTLVNFRKGFRNIPSEVLAGMARELGTNVDFLLERSDDTRAGAVIREETRVRDEARRTS